MQLKIVTHYLLLSCIVPCIMAKAVNHGGIKEDVREEVPSDEIPSNSTTIAPPSTCNNTTTSKPTPTTETYPITTTMPATIAPESKIPTTAIPITALPITTTSYPVETTTNPKDLFKKYNSECKVECKEKPNYDDYSEYSTSTEAPPATSYKGATVIEPLIYASDNKNHSVRKSPSKPKVSYYTKSLPTATAPHSVYKTSYVQPEAGSNYLYLPKSEPHPRTKYYDEPTSFGAYVPFENINSKVIKSLYVPEDNTGHIYTDSSPSYSNNNRHSSSYQKPAYSPGTSLKVSHLDSDAYIGNSPHYEDSINKLINELLNSNPSNTAPYETYSSPFYSVSYIR